MAVRSWRDVKADIKKQKSKLEEVNSKLKKLNNKKQRFQEAKEAMNKAVETTEQKLSDVAIKTIKASESVWKRFGNI